MGEENAMDLNEQAMIEAGKVVSKRRGDVLFRTGDAGEHMYVVLEGTVELMLEQDGNRIPVAKFGKGDFFGEMSLLEGLPRSGTAVAAGEVRLALLHEEAFRRLMLEDGGLAWRVMKGLSTRIRGMNRELVQRIGHDLQEVSAALQLNADGITAGIGRIAASAGEIDTNERHLASQIKEVQHISGQIGSMLDFIRNVASQTHILGLNASIEAARGGEHGRGFAVIAEEIRKLSVQSKENAEKIAELTGQIGYKMKAITSASEDSARKSNEQAAATRQMVTAVGEVAGLAERLTGIADSLK